MRLPRLVLLLLVSFLIRLLRSFTLLSRPIREVSSKLPKARADLGEFNALLGSAPRAGSVPVRGSAGVFGRKNQR